MTSSVCRALGVIALTLLAASQPGCGWGGGDLSGTVTMNGGPFAHGWVTVTFPNGEHPPLSALIGRDGSYRVAGCPAGAAKITVNPANPSAVTKKGTAAKTPTVPARYTDAVRTDLTCELTDRAQTFDIDLKP